MLCGWVPFYEGLGANGITETKSRMGVPGANGSFVQMHTVSVLEDEGYGDGWWCRPHNFMPIVHTSEPHAYKWLKFMLCIFFHN